ncbi:MAG: MATE family efflux transporter [Lachnospiraceae bacterium]|nr:MATE family efflux transporter [Lachnospiraceae bacterium]
MSDHALDQEWRGASLLGFAFPTIVMMIFMGLYTVVDTIFVARYVSTDALSAVNIVCPVIHVTVGLGTMLAAGGNAVVSRNMGARREQEAMEDFTLLVTAAAALGFVILIAGTLWIDELVYALGASDLLFPYCKDYLGVLFLFIPANIIQTVFANLFVTAGRPGLGCGLAVIAGLANIVLDYVFLEICGFGIRGAALGTGCGYLIPAMAGLGFFWKSKGGLSFRRPKWRWGVLGESCLNGSSEMVGQLAAAVTTYLFNIAMMDLLGEDGVAAITIMIYSQFLLNTLYIGFSMGVAPVIGFQYGSQNREGQRKVFQISISFLAMASLLLFAVSSLGGPWIIGGFVPETSRVYSLAEEGFSIFSYSFLFCGLNIFTSAMFTALSNGKVSGVLSFLRTFGFLTSGILLLPRIWGIAGIWLAVPVAEGSMFFVSVICLLYYNRRYGYGP